MVDCELRFLSKHVNNEVVVNKGPCYFGTDLFYKVSSGQQGLQSEAL